MKDQHRLSGRQITTMVLAVCVAVVLAPVGVFAAAKHSAVSIADGKHPSRLAQVATDGAQLVNVTGSTSVVGTVTAAPGKPVSPYSDTGTSSTTVLKVTVPTGTHFIVETVSAQIQVMAAVTVAGVKLDFVENGHASHLYLSLPRVSPSDGSAPAVFMATVPAAIYPDPGSTVTVTPEYDAAVAPTMDVTLSGYRA